MTRSPQYYGDIEAKKYTNKYVPSLAPRCPRELTSHSSRIQQIQADMTYRALELLNLPPDEPAFLLDIGCGSGLSGEILDEEGHVWVGVDVAPSMLGESTAIRSTTARRTSYFSPEVALEREVEGDLFLQDIGQGFGFRPGSFDGAIRSVPPLLDPS